MRKLFAKDVMSKDVVYVNENTTVSEAANLFLEEMISGAPVVDDEGTMTDRPENVANDTVKLAAEAHEPPSAAERITPFKPSSAGTASR